MKLFYCPQAKASGNSKPVAIESQKKYINRNGIYSILNNETRNQSIVHKAIFLLSKIEVRFGAFAIVPNEVDNGIIAGFLWLILSINPL